MTVEIAITNYLLRPITTGANSTVNQSEFIAVTRNLHKTRKKSHVQGGIGFDFASQWLKNWRGIFKPITKRNNRNHIVTFDSHLKTSLIPVKLTEKTCYLSEMPYNSPEQTKRQHQGDLPRKRGGKVSSLSADWTSSKEIHE